MAILVFVSIYVFWRIDQLVREYQIFASLIRQSQLFDVVLRGQRCNISLAIFELSSESPDSGVAANFRINFNIIIFELVGNLKENVRLERNKLRIGPV